jgi:hypothetical protein
MALLSLDANVGVESTGLVPLDPRLEQLRALLLGREIELTRHFHETIPSSWRSKSAILNAIDVAMPRGDLSRRA